MKFFISIDMEGLAGTTSWKEYEKEPERWKRLLTQELKACIDGIRESSLNIEEIRVCDSHGWGTNILFEELEGISVVRGFPRTYYMLESLDESFDCLYLLGYHAGIGTKKALMDHTYSSSSIYKIRVNNRDVSEAEINGYYAGEFGVPVGFISGDDKLISQISLIFDEKVEKAITKQGISRFSAVIRPFDEVLKEIREKSKRAALKCKEIPPLKISTPIITEIELTDTLRADFTELIPEVERISGREIRFKAENAKELYRLLMLIVTLSSVAKSLL